LRYPPISLARLDLANAPFDRIRFPRPTSVDSRIGFGIACWSSFEIVQKTAIYELFAWTLLILTSAALIWIVAPLVLLGIRLCSPTAAALLNFAPPGHCTVSVDDWFVVKRVLVGYLGLCLVLGLVFLVGCVSLHLLREKRQGTVHHWSVFLDDSDYE
jgi:hypothetical protein